MATRDEKLIGFQLVNKINVGNNVADQIGWMLQRKNPQSQALLRYEPPPVISGGETYPPARDATTGDITQLCIASAAVVDVEVEQRLKGFLDNYADQDQITNGLAHFNIVLPDVDDDKTTVIARITTVKAVVSESMRFSQLALVGESVLARIKKIFLQVNPEVHLDHQDKMIIAFQDLFNAISYELQGLSSGTGNKRFTTVESILARMQHRFRTIEGWYAKNVPHNAETNFWYNTVYQEVLSELAAANNMNKLKNIGLYVAANVPQLPLVRRHWQYG